ncbi:hypothetical protein Agabi119p4_2268 [Agaricus bisporus var. burnettii]|uniref:Uncharacterized protein n=1 Tax=Agaricus bisporus var. burnettii TaxID=192524 RepID=A0A8H7F8Y7_AGABI|nr:hypothetical protein Agabi119p4_2268 [Agaricus bisporus var. burnettii]
MQSANAPIHFEPLPFIVESLPLTIRWKLERPLDGAIEVVLASFGQRAVTSAQLIPNFILNAEHNLRSGIIPLIDLDPGLYVILAMNRTSRDSILAASQGFYFLPTPDTSLSIQSGYNAQANSTSLQKSGACEILLPSTIRLPHLNSQMMALISMSAFLSLSVVVILFIMLWRSFKCHRAKGNSSEEECNRDPRVVPFVLSENQPVISTGAEKNRETSKDRAYSLSSSLADMPPVSFNTCSSSFNTCSSSPTSLASPLSTGLKKPLSALPLSPKTHFTSSAQNHITSSNSSSRVVSAGQRSSSPPPHYCADRQFA